MPQSSTQNFAYKVQEAYFADNTTALRDSFDEYQRSHCYNPQRLSLTSAHDCIPVLRDVDCGKCYHCKETKINSWVTRMYAHCENYPYVYFVTLTYRPFYKLGPVSDLVLKKINGALFHYDNLNSEKRLGWNPTLLCKRHYQTFLKRLRKNTQNDSITYCVCGEYGHDYGRPHFHLILFSKSPIQEIDIRRAWSVGMWKSNTGEWSYLRNQKHNGKAYYFEIGRIQFDDLVTNGSFNEKHLFVDGQNLDARNCFAYVVKYVCKADESNESRVKLAYNCLYERNCVKRKIYGDFNEENMQLSREERKRRVIEYRLHFYIKNKQTDFVTYYETQFKNDEYLYTRDLPLYEDEEQTKPIYPQNSLDFCSKFAQFVEVSRGCPIGSLYAKAHLPQFVQGVFAKPDLQNNGFVVPAYFRRKAEEYVYGLRKVQKTIRSRSLVFSPLPLLLRHFKNVYENGAPFRYGCPFDLFRTRSLIIRQGLYAFKDVSTGEHIIFPRQGKRIRAEYYRYDRHSKEYVLTRFTSLNSFLSEYIPKLEESIKRFNIAAAAGKENARLLERSTVLLEEYGMTLHNLRGRFADAQREYLTHRQHDYHMTHTACE